MADQSFDLDDLGFSLLGEPEVEEPQIETDPIDEIEDESRRDIDALIHQGYLSDSFSFGGHSFVIRTLNAKEVWSVANAMKQFMGTLAEVRTYMAATVGLALVSYDGNPDFHIKLDDQLEHAIKRLDFIGSWDEIVIDYCFSRYTALDQRRVRARESITNLSTENRATS